NTNMDVSIELLNAYIPWQRIFWKYWREGNDAQIEIPLLHAFGLNGYIEHSGGKEEDKKPKNVIIHNFVLEDAMIEYKNGKMKNSMKSKIDYLSVPKGLHLRELQYDICFQ